MTKKDFAFVASVIAEMPSHSATLRAQKMSCARAFVRACFREFPKFNAVVFWESCGFDLIDL